MPVRQLLAEPGMIKTGRRPPQTAGCICLPLTHPHTERHACCSPLLDNDGIVLAASSHTTLFEI